MTEESAIRDLFGRWEQVWNEGRLELALDCVAPVYVRHEPPGTRQVTPQEYAAEIVARQQERPKTHIVVYDHAIDGDRVWLRWTWHWSDSNTGQVQVQSGLQVYRVESGKLAETWVSVLPDGTTWPDTSGQEHWVTALNVPSNNSRRNYVSHANETRLRDLYAVFATGNLPGFLDGCTDDVIFTAPGNSRASGVFTKGQFTEWIMGILGVTQMTFQEHVLDVFANDEHGVLLLEHEFDRDGAHREYGTAHIVELREGKISKWTEHPGSLREFEKAWGPAS